MDPYLERHWRDVHADLIALSRTALNSALPNDLVARMEERVVIDHVNYGRPRAIYRDVRVYEDRGGAQPSTAPQAAAVMAEPIVLELETEEHTETYVQILDADGGELITVIEFLSPTNKLPGRGRDEYRRKRDELTGSKVNVVEVDLMRAGTWRELLRPVVAPGDVQTAYRVITRRFHPMERIELYPISIRQPLPIIPIPLRDRDRDVPLALQGLIEQAYRNGRYDHTDYSQSCDPPLDEEDAAWADGLLREAGRRRSKSQ
jgi:hypothetical protein